MRTFLYPLLLFLSYSANGADVDKVVIPVQQCHAWASNAAVVVQYKLEKISLEAVLKQFKEQAESRGLSTKTLEYLAVYEMIKRIYKEENDVEKAYVKYLLECVQKNGVIFEINRKAGII